MQLKLRLADHPWSLVAFGALAGIWLASYSKRRPRARPPGVIGAALGALALKLVRDAAVYEMSKIAKTWFAAPPPPRAPYAS
jgi:hypothetical protein